MLCLLFRRRPLQPSCLKTLLSRRLHTGRVERVTLTPVGNLDVLAKRWRALEVESDGGFFRSWTFLGCEATARFSRASLLSVTQDGVDVALGLLGTCNGQLWLNETGLPELDASFIEHNGLLVRRDQQASVPAALRHATQAGRAVVLSGIDDQMLGAAREAGWAVVRQSRFAPCVTLHTLKGPFLDTLSANARAQIRRSFRSYGPSLRLSRAATLTEALGWFEQMVQLHQTSWIRRGKPGAFAAATARKFHADLIARAWVRGETELLRIDAEGEVVGILYVFVQNCRAHSYQSAFNNKPGNARHKPRLL